MTGPKSLIVCAAGMKGLVFLAGICARGLRPAIVYSYEQEDDRQHSFAKIRSVSEQHGILFHEATRPRLEHDDLVFIVGWQYLLPNCGRFAIVFHDSLLPRYRGFAPTVTALLNGDRELGVTALSPQQEMDAGPIFAQAARSIAYPIKIETALRQQTELMIDLGKQLHEDCMAGRLVSHEQDHAAATYSLWRDEADYLIDWSFPAADIARFVDAVGYPYGGARTFAGDDQIIINDVSPRPDVAVERRQPGKIFQLDADRPVVVCGEGLLRIDAACLPDGTRYQFRRLRVRLGAGERR
jgi:methionyl-tRNA formyltransferase